MFVIGEILVLVLCLLVPQIRSIQLRLVNDGDSLPSDYENRKPDVYSYNYDVSDQSTGDSKTKWEKQRNGVVHGSYSILEPDGSTRLVQYTADANGFHPIVTKLDSPNLSQTYNIPTPQDNLHRRDFLTGSYNSYNNRAINPYQSHALNADYNGYHNTVRGYNYYDNSNPIASPRHPPLGRERQPVPLLHSTYHGYDNLYH